MIQVVDDDPAFRKLVEDLLRQAGYEVQAFESPRAALEAAELRRPRLAILDVCMPELSGYEVCRRLRDLYADSVPVLFVSGERVEAIDRTAGLLLGGDDYLVKPFAPGELIARVVSLLRRAPGRSDDEVDAVVLTVREHAVLELLAEGMSRREIGVKLFISPKTVDAHLSRIYEKLGVRGRVQALRAAYRSRILQPL